MKQAEIIYEDNHLIVINKPAGFLVQGDSTGDEPILDVLKKYIRREYNKPGNVFLSPNHRLDRPVSGVLVFSKTSKALSRTNLLFQKNKVRKKYWGIVEGVPDPIEGKLEHFIAKNRNKNVSFVTKQGKLDSKRCVLRYRVLKVINNISLVEVLPETGRSHQIRVQMASLKTPIIGDLKYGSDQKMEDRSIALHCAEMEFIHPVQKEPLILKAEAPDLQIWNNFIS